VYSGKTVHNSKPGCSGGLANGVVGCVGRRRVAWNAWLVEHTERNAEAAVRGSQAIEDVAAVVEVQVFARGRVDWSQAIEDVAEVVEVQVFARGRVDDELPAGAVDLCFVKLPEIVGSKERVVPRRALVAVVLVEQLASWVFVNLDVFRRL